MKCGFRNHSHGAWWLHLPVPLKPTTFRSRFLFFSVITATVLSRSRHPSLYPAPNSPFCSTDPRGLAMTLQLPTESQIATDNAPALPDRSRYGKTVLVLGLASVLSAWVAPHNSIAGTVAGVTSGSLSVTETGSANYTVPIAIPPGIGGMQPSLALSYHSLRGNGIAGVGWDLSASSSINRCAQNLAQDGAIHGIDFSAKDRFCLDGQRLVAITGTYGADGTEYRTEIESFARIISHGTAGSGPLYFTVETKSGEVMEYGTSPDARLGVPGQGEIRLWSLNRIDDTVGNAVTYHYTEDAANSTYEIDRIEYTRNDQQGVSPQNEVRFIYESRPDKHTQYLAGTKLVSNKRLSAVEAYTSNGNALFLVKSYKLDYELSPTNSRSRLTSITECGPSNSCLRPIRLNWNAASFPWQLSTANRLPSNLLLGVGAGELRAGDLVDVNGDGLPDWVRSYIHYNGSNNRTTFLNTENGWQVDSAYRLPDYLYDLRGGGQKRGDFVDVNGDGLVDWVSAYRTSSGSTARRTYVNTGAGWQIDPNYQLPSIQYDQKGTPPLRRGEFLDVNGDGRVDWVMAFTTRSGSTSRATYLNTGTGWQIDAGYQPPSALLTNNPSPSNVDYQTTVGRMIDLNGDGLPDWLRLLTTSGQPSGAAYINTGSGWSADSRYNLPLTVNGQSVGMTFRFGHPIDVNGDGLTDWVNGYKSHSSVQVNRFTLLNTGKGWELSSAYKLPVYTNTFVTADDYGFVEAHEAHYGQFSDVNGDGLVDWMQAYLNGSGKYIKTYENTGNGWQANSVFNAPNVLFYDSRIGTARISALADVNGDGVVDAAFGASGWESLFPRDTYLGVSQDTDLLLSVTDSLDRTSTLEFASLINDTVYTKDHDAVFPVVDLQTPLYVVKSVSSDDGVGGQKITSYKYAGAKTHLQGRGFRGFRRVSATDQQTGVTTTIEYGQEFPFVARIISSSQSLTDGTTISTIANTWESLSLNGGATSWPYVAGSVSEYYEPNDGIGNAPVVSQTTTAVFDDYGNPTSMVTTTSELGQSFTDTTINTYTNDTTNWFLGLLLRSEVMRSRPGGP